MPRQSLELQVLNINIFFFHFCFLAVLAVESLNTSQPTSMTTLHATTTSTAATSSTTIAAASTSAATYSATTSITTTSSNIRPTETTEGNKANYSLVIYMKSNDIISIKCEPSYDSTHFLEEC